MEESNNEDLIALCTAYVNRYNSQNPAIVDKVLVDGADVHIHFSWARGSSEDYVTALDLMAFAWNNPKP